MHATTTTTMNPEIKALWTGRLRSGEIEQGREYLGLGEARCCLGVLCDLAGIAEVIDVREGTYYADDGDTAINGWLDYGQGNEETLPDLVQEWAGLSGNGACNPIVVVPAAFIPRLPGEALALLGVGGEPGAITLAQLNDAGVPFGLIADIIDATL